VEIECLPADLPEYLEVDVSALPLNGLVHLSESKLPKGVTIPALAQGPEHDQVVASISRRRRSWWSTTPVIPCQHTEERRWPELYTPTGLGAGADPAPSGKSHIFQPKAIPIES
jgi:hypothetical protein